MRLRAMIKGTVSIILMLLPLQPLLANDAETLKKTEAELKNSEKRYSSLGKDSAALEKELDKIRNQMVNIAKGVRQHEIDLLKLEESQALLTQKVEETEQDLETRRNEIQSLLQSLIRLSRVPPEAVVAMPGNVRHTLQAAELLETLTERMREQTIALNQALEGLQKNRRSLEMKHGQITLAKGKLEEQEKQLNQTLEERRIIFRKLNRSRKQEEAKIAALKSKSKNLKELLANIESDRKKMRNQHARLKAVPQTKPNPPKTATADSGESETIFSAVSRLIGADTRSFAEMKGALSLPVIGRIKYRYGQKLQQNQTHRGLTISSRTGAQVITPVSGEVVFTGQFMDYGPMVIVQVDKQHHLLLAGLEDILCEEGQKVSSGEPLGRLATSDTKPNLYLELRKNTAPIDPAPWFKS